jgi:exosortase
VLSIIQSTESRLTSWWTLWPLLVIPVAAWQSIMLLGSYVGTDTPLSFVALVPLLALYLLIHDAGRHAAVPERRDPFVDGIVFALLVIGCLCLLLVVPARFSWYYWLLRLDLLAVPLFATAVVALFWGLGGIAILWRALLYLVLVWPYLLLWLHQMLAPVLTAITTLFAAVVVRLLSLPFTVSPDDSARFLSTSARQFSIVIADSCSGTNALLGFIVVGLPLLLTWSGRPLDKLGWLLLGSMVAFISNLVRVGLLMYVSVQLGIEVAFGIIHPILGTVLFVTVFVGMLLLARAFRLSFESGCPSDDSRTLLAMRPGFRSPRTVAVSVAALLMAVSQTTLAQYAPVTAQSLPSTAVGEAWNALPELPGWTREWQPEIGWQNLYGRDSQSRVVVYRSTEGSAVVQFIATPDLGLLNTYTPEQCTLFHGDDIVGVSTVSLGYGVSARLVEAHRERGEERRPLISNTLYWLMPVTVGGQVYHTRVAILADTDMVADGGGRPVQPIPQPVTQFQNWLSSLLSPYSSAGLTPEFAGLDGFTVSFGSRLVAAFAEGEGRAVAAPKH